LALGYGVASANCAPSCARAGAPLEPVVRFETAPGDQMQVDWVEFRKGAIRCTPSAPPLGYSRASYVEFVTDMKVRR
jgi:transposase